jgi:methyl-accepting chemotaxis protein
MRHTVDAMGAISGSAEKIAQIIGVIDEIAFQTNLLALNAGVEASRAGDAGRGFAVVASEVRALAQRSADAAKEIKALISSSTVQVQQGVKLVGETERSLEHIRDHIVKMNGSIDQIAASARDQASALDQINTAMGEMDRVTQQNAGMVQEATGSCHQLSEETNKLVSIIRQFRISQMAAPASARQAPRRRVA